MSNLSRFIRYHALRNPPRTAIAYAGKHVGYAEMWMRVIAVARWLETLGVARGQKLALLMKNSPAFIELAMAASHIGAVLVPINFRLSPHEVDYILSDSEASMLFVDEELAAWNAKAAAQIIVTPEAQHDVLRLPGCKATPGEAPPMADVGNADLLRIMYTSGTTDHPKGVVHTYGNFLAKSSDHIVALGLNAESRLLIAGPLYHVGAFDLPGVGVLCAGGMLCIQRDFDAATALELIAAERLNGAWLAPVMSSAILCEQARAPRDTSSLRWVIGGGERTPEARIHEFSEAFPNGRYIDAYGLTETCGGDTLMEAGREIEKIGSVGRPLPCVDISIRDDQGQLLPAGADGEICVRGEKVTKGYWHAPEKTAASFFGHWLRTGDVGYLDDEGFLFITDRKKDLIISGGENIASSEVERAIQEMPQVLDSAVVGVPDAQWGERPVAFVVLQAGASLSESDIREHCRGRLARFKVPDRIVFQSGLPRSASGKVLKRELRDQLKRN